MVVGAMNGDLGKRALRVLRLCAREGVLCGLSPVDVSKSTVKIRP